MVVVVASTDVVGGSGVAVGVEATVLVWGGEEVDLVPTVLVPALSSTALVWALTRRKECEDDKTTRVKSVRMRAEDAKQRIVGILG